MDKRVFRTCEVVVAVGIGLTFSTGHGIAVAEPPASDSSETAASTGGPDPQGPVHANEDDANTAEADENTDDDAETPGEAAETPREAAETPDETPDDMADVADAADAADADDADDADDAETPEETSDDDDAETPETPDVDVAVEDDDHAVPRGTGQRHDRDRPSETDVSARESEPSAEPAVDVSLSSEANPPAVAARPVKPERDAGAPRKPGRDDVSAKAVAIAPVSDSMSTQQAATSTQMVSTKPVSFVAKLLSAFGIRSTTAPTESPFLCPLLAWVRRLFGVPIVPPATGDPTTSEPTTGSPSQPPSAATTINVRDYGALGDGVADDSAAIKAAEAALTSGGRLYFAQGDYRFAQQHPSGSAAILLKGLSNVTVEFEPGARLLMDNLKGNGHGTSHGIRVEGAASHVTILNPTIVWGTRPSARSFGDGISVLGWASDSPPPPTWTGSTGTVEFVSIVNGRTVNAPQAGAVVMGASDVAVTNLTAVGTMGDGLHLNSNRRVTVDGLVAENTGDDGLAFVTYYDDSLPWTYRPGDGPFNQSGLGEWNNGGSVASNITVTGGRANGFRVQGGHDITISEVTVTDKEFGFHVNSANATGPHEWTSLASRNVAISDVTIDGAQTGVVLATNAIDGTEDPMWWDFSGVSIADVTIRGAANWSLAVETPATTTSRLAGITLRNIYAETGHDPDGPIVGGNGGIMLASLRDSVIDNVRLVSGHSSDINVLGASQLRSQYSVEELPASNLSVNELILEGPGRILIQDIAGVRFGTVASYGAHSSAVMLYRVKDASFDTIRAYMPGRGDGPGYGLQLLQFYDVDVTNVEVTSDDHTGSIWWAVELGGGNPEQYIAGRGVRIEKLSYVSGSHDIDPRIAVQAGRYGPVDWYIRASWRHEAELQWRSELYGDVVTV